MCQLDIIDAPAMEVLGQKLARLCPAGCKLFLQGELGAGKTTLVRGFLSGLGYQGIVKSPTYTLVEPYQLNNLEIFHFDLYRLNDPEELESIGIRDYFSGSGTCLVEWPEKGAALLGTPDVFIQIQYQDEQRKVLLVAKTKTGKEIIRDF
ncbi:MAG: tRNA threonylcarbamoyladenosine biosynthesis protein TsaE [Gammaproteobacteria bacterium]|jgi:tRNA threonylcarbamoyladenosine biosynthesis protein TsaE